MTNISKEQAFWGLILFTIIILFLNEVFEINNYIKPILIKLKREYLKIKREYKKINYSELRRNIRQSIRELRKISTVKGVV